MILRLKNIYVKQKHHMGEQLFSVADFKIIFIRAVEWAGGSMTATCRKVIRLF